MLTTARLTLRAITDADLPAIFALRSDPEKKGIMQEAMAAAIDYTFYRMRQHSAEANVNPANQVSFNLLKRTGSVQDAYFKKRYFYDSRYFDSALYSLLTTKKQQTCIKFVVYV